MKSTLYLETSVASYYVSRPSRDVIVLARQEITRDWWDNRLWLYDSYVSPVVLEEIRRGDSNQAQQRHYAVATFPVLRTTRHVEKMADMYAREFRIPLQALRDAAHLAFACFYELDYLVTWNFAHLANGEIRRRLNEFNAVHGIHTPIICSPEELMGTEDDGDVY